VTEQATEEQAAELARELVASLAPQELPLFGAVSRAFLEAGGEVRQGRGGGDEVLGFGLAEAAALLTPAALAVSVAVGRHLAEEIRKAFVAEASGFVAAQLRRLFRREPAAVTLTQAQLAQVRAIALEAAGRVRLPADRAALLADALVGRLAAGGPG
jgi:hypothetical protein